MKELAWFALLVVLPLGCNAGTDSIKTESKTLGTPSKAIREVQTKVDLAKAANATAVLRVQLIEFHGGSKYHWDTVKVIHVIKKRKQLVHSRSIVGCALWIQKRPHPKK